MKEQFIDKNFTSASLETIGWVNDIIREYERLNLRLSLRQLYYQMVSRGLIPNTERSYKNFGNLVSEGRLAGAIDWAMIEDRGRITVQPSVWDTPESILDAAARSFRLNKWLFQSNYVEVMCEKDALSGVLEPVCRRLEVPYTANRGYSSSSSMYDAGKRLRSAFYRKQHVTVIYLGDHDPSGIDMTRDIDDRLSMFSGLSVEDMFIKRVALNYDQVQELDPPENPAKESDSRAASYIAEFGHSSWELDAIEPTELASIVERSILTLRDDEQWEVDLMRERHMKDDLVDFGKTFGEWKSVN